MEYILEYNNAAMVIYCIVFCLHVFRKKTDLLQNRLFTVLVVVSFIGVISNNLSAMIIMERIAVPMWIASAVQYTYFVLLDAAPFIFYLYVVSFNTNSLSKISFKTKCYMWIPTLIWILLLIVNPFFNTIFSFGTHVSDYQRGNMQILLYLVAFFYGIMGVVDIVHNKEKVSVFLRLSVYLFFGVGLVCCIIQFFHQEHLMQHFGISICEMLILLAVQQPEEYLDAPLGVFSKQSFQKIFEMHLKSGNPMQMILLYFEDWTLYSQILGEDNTNRFFRLVTKFLSKLCHSNIYYISRKCFVMTCSEKDDLETLVQTIDERFKRNWQLESQVIDMKVRMITLQVPEDVRSIEEVYGVRDALTNMKSLKGSRIYYMELNLEQSRRVSEVEQAIYRAIEQESFEMYYQPIYSIREEKFVSAEALVRLNDPELGFIPPDEFITLSEKNGSILQIGEQIFKQVFSFIQSGVMQKQGVQYIEINLSTIQCMQENFAKELLQLMKQYTGAKDYVNLEITETAAVNSPQILLNNMMKLYQSGISFSLDDYGTGYSNITTLSKLPLHIIKLDKSLMDMVVDNPKGRIVLESSVAMAKKLQMQIVAEGVETKEQLNLLKELKVDFIQGYYFSKPLPKEQFVQFIKERNGGINAL